jgi:tetratricopeptide (TPR) repeat protein
LCYSHADATHVARLQAALEEAGVRVWRDTAELRPGEDWRAKTRRAIATGAAFIAGFSQSALERRESVQFEELTWAMEQFRKRQPGLPWLIPVRFDECEIPDLPLPFGGTLLELQYVDLFGEGQEHGTRRLVAAVKRLASPAAGPGSSMPPDPPEFTGRDNELAEIAAAAGAGRVVVIHGMPGVGKTALAIRAVHALRHDYPARPLFLDLHGHTRNRDPVPAETALAMLLAATGMSARDLPATMDARTGLWRNRMSGERALLVLDNAASASQVTPLLPGGRCLVLVTSRPYLGDLAAAVRVELGPLRPHQAQDMFTRLAPRGGADPAYAISKVVERAGYLPLAVSLLARVYAGHSRWTINDLIMETGKPSMLHLKAESETIAAAFETSFRFLDPAEQQFFRRLGLHPGTTIDPNAAAALHDTGTTEATELLDSLHRARLLTEAGYRRYSMHDLIRLFARELAAKDTEETQGQAVERLLDHYQHVAALVEVRLRRQTRPCSTTFPAAIPVTDPKLPSRYQAIQWARAERANLLACLDHVTATAQHARIVALTAGLADVLRHDGPWRAAIDLHAQAAEAAEHLGDPISQGNALNDRGILELRIGKYKAAQASFEKAKAIYDACGNQLGQANALLDLATIQRLTEYVPDAVIAKLDSILGIYRDLGDQLGEANTLSDLGTMRQLTHNYRGALRNLRDALAIYGNLGHQAGEATVLIELAKVQQLTGDNAGAVNAAREALAVYRDFGHRLGEANALLQLAATSREENDYPTALAYLNDALNIYRNLGHIAGEAQALMEQSNQLLAADLPNKARESYQCALSLAREIGILRYETEAFKGLDCSAHAIDPDDKTRAPSRWPKEP